MSTLWNRSLTESDDEMQLPISLGVRQPADKVGRLSLKHVKATIFTARYALKGNDSAQPSNVLRAAAWLRRHILRARHP